MRLLLLACLLLLATAACDRSTGPPLLDTEAESKGKPLSDDKLEKMLNARGYNIARRTVAKYREQLNIPVARLRKEL